MRFVSLLLDRFGHFTDGALDLSARTGLHVVCGPNEAGKTTILAAVTDLLFGIEARSAFNFRHDYADMRIGAEIEARDGRRLRFWRRKGRQNTLLGADGASLPDGLLSGFLGPAVDRDLFQGLFGLDHQRLRRGGEDILQAKGEVGRMLFEAGAGLAGLGQALRELDGEAGDLFSARRVASKPFYQALDRFTKARNRQREAAVASTEWRELEERLAETAGRLDANRAALAELEMTRAKAERQRRILPLATALKTVAARLEELAGAVDLPDGSAEEHAREKHRTALAEQSRERCAAMAASLAAEIEAVTVPEALLAEGYRIQELFEQRAAMRDQRTDLPKRRAELRQLREQVGDLLRRIGSPLPVERARDAVPPQPVLGEVRALILEDGRLRERAAAVADQLAKAEEDRARLRGQLARVANAMPPDGLKAALAEVKAKGDLEAAADEARAAAERLAIRRDRMLASLGLWSGDAEALERAPVPAEASVNRFEAAYVELAAEEVRLAERRAALAEDARRTEREIALLTGQGDVPDAAAVAEARRRRDRGWRLVRRLHVEGGAVAGEDEDAAGFAGPQPLADAFEGAMRAADLLADRKEAEAQRVARYGELVRRREEIAGRTEALTAETERLAVRRRETEADWQALWRASGVVPLPPREMLAWLGRREALLREHEAACVAAVQTDRLAAEHAAARRLIASSLTLPAGEAGTLRLLVRRAEETAARLEADAAERRRIEDRLVEQAAALDRARQETERAAAAGLSWRNRWDRVSALFGPEGAAPTPAAVEATLSAIVDLDRKLVQIDEMEHRVIRMEGNLQAFDAAVLACGLESGCDLAGFEPEAAAGELFARLSQARLHADRRADLTRRLAEARNEAEASEREAAEGRDALARLMRSAGAEDEAGLLLAIERSRERHRLMERRTELERELLAVGDGLDLPALLAEAGDADPDRLAALLARLREELEALHAEGMSLGAEKQELGARRAELQRGRGADLAAQEAQEALAALRSVAEDYARLRASATLLHRAVDRYRQEQQGPLLGRATELFRLLTGGAFAGLRVDYDDRDQPVLRGIRDGGTVVPVEGMSDGTRDQLYLALRLAAVERYVGTAEPLPFVADDLLINFDDGRSGAALRVLGELAGRTQVLFFTHHPHLCDLAAQELGGDGFMLHHLRRP